MMLVNVKLEIDTGSHISTISEKYLHFMTNVHVKPTKIEAKSYSGDVIQFVGEVNLCLQHSDKSIFHTFYIVNASSSSLMGRDLCKKLNLHLTIDDKTINVIQFSVRVDLFLFGSKN